ncbi:MAG: hypothetical protein Q4G05_01340 [Clostridia bacterium]|nr:hypothetical protein [Clostridia bacterium]
MLKANKITIIIIALFIVATISSSVLAASLSEVKYADSKITVSGTCETGNQAAIAIFNSDKQPIYFATVKVENSKFNEILPANFDFENGETFTIKVANYNGDEVSTESFVVNTENAKGIAGEEEKDVTPKTGVTYNLEIFSLLGVAAIITKLVLKK